MISHPRMRNIVFSGNQFLGYPNSDSKFKTVDRNPEECLKLLLKIHVDLADDEYMYRIL